jgi:hypothetical protein
MGEDQRIRESRTFLQAATATLVINIVETLLDLARRAFGWTRVRPDVD